MNEWISFEGDEPYLGVLYDVLLPDGQIVERIKAAEVKGGWLPEIKFRQYPKATHFRKSC